MIARVALALVVAVALSSASAAARQPDAADPTFSPTGTHIAYTVASSPRQRLVVAATASGRGVRTLFSTANGCCDPIRWAAAGRIVFSTNYALLSVPAAGGAPITLTKSSRWFILSPNRETVAFVDGCDCGHAADAIGIVPVRGGTPLIVPKPDDATDSIDGFSPDGTELVFTRYPFESAGPPVTMVEQLGGGNPVPGNPVPLSQSGLIGASQLPAGATRVQWSPDGRWIAFVRNLQLETVSTSGGSPRVVATRFGANAFSWSPRSTRLAFDESFGKTPPVVSNRRLVTVDPRGGHRIVLWKDPSLHYISNDSTDWPQWSRDGSTLVFMAIRGPARPAAHVWVVRPDGRGLRRVA